MSNSVQLKHVFKQGSSHQFYGTQVFLGMISIFMCTCIGKSIYGWTFALARSSRSVRSSRVNTCFLLTDSRRCTNVYISLRSSTIDFYGHCRTNKSISCCFSSDILRSIFSIQFDISHHSHVEILNKKKIFCTHSMIEQHSSNMFFCYCCWICHSRVWFVLFVF